MRRVPARLAWKLRELAWPANVHRAGRLKASANYLARRFEAMCIEDSAMAPTDCAHSWFTLLGGIEPYDEAFNTDNYLHSQVGQPFGRWV